MKRILPILFIFSFVLGQYDQLFVGTRPMSMGGAFTAVADDANTITWNPAGPVSYTHLTLPTKA